MNQKLNTYKSNYDSINISFTTQSYNNSTISNAHLNLNQMFAQYKYFKVLSLTKKGNGTYNLKVWNSNTSSSSDVSLNTQYLRSTYSTIYARAKSTRTEECACQVNIQFYN